MFLRVAFILLVAKASFGTKLFPATEWMYKDITSWPLDAQSSQIINGISASGGWGNGKMQIDFSLVVLQGNYSTVTKKSFTKTGDFYTPDCDFTPIPIPPNGAIEGETGYTCVSDGDCHLIVHDTSTKRLYEMWRANINGSTFNGGCLAMWNTGKTFLPNGRGDGCTSADAGGFPIASLLFTVEEVVTNQLVDHAIRFILPNNRIRRKTYVYPATHATSSTGVDPTSPPYGARLRLKSTFNLTALPNNYARVVARAMQTYGIVLSDGGNVALTAASDRFSTAKWSGKLGSNDLTKIKITDFDVVNEPAPLNTGKTRFTQNGCTRSSYTY
jgi:serine/threonine-protein kinase